MIKETITPKNNTIQIRIPDELVNKELEISITPTTTVANQSSNQELLKKLNQLFEKAKSIKIPKHINIDKLTNDMNNDKTLKKLFLGPKGYF